MQRIIKDYYEQLYTNKMENLEERYRFLEMYNLPRLNQEEIENMSRPITSNQVEWVTTTITTKNSLRTKLQDHMELHVNSTKRLGKS